MSAPPFDDTALLPVVDAAPACGITALIGNPQDPRTADYVNGRFG